MSTLRPPTRFLPLKVALSLGLSLSFGLAGCTSLSGMRTGAASKPKTSVAVGDKTLPVQSGESGSTVASDDRSEPAVPRRRVRADGRISGRVADDLGRPVPNARVRLAVSGTNGGRVVTATTDRSGGFTLHGLRPGSTYTVIAESDSADGPMTGRATARTSDTDVKISIAPQDNEAAPERAEAPSRVKNVSDREATDEAELEAPRLPDEAPGSIEPAPQPRGSGSSASVGMRGEDLPPALEAEALQAPSIAPRRAASTTRRPSETASNIDPWKRIDRETTPARNVEQRLDSEPEPRILADPARSKRAESVPIPVDRGSTGTTEAPSPGLPVYEEGVNPLPPAIEPGQDQAMTEPPAELPTAEFPPINEPAADKPEQVALNNPPTDLPPALEPPAERTVEKPPPTKRNLPPALEAAPKMPTRSMAYESPSRPTEPIFPERKVETAPGARVVMPETYAPIVLDEAPQASTITPKSTKPAAQNDAPPPAMPAPALAQDDTNSFHSRGSEPTTQADPDFLDLNALAELNKERDAAAERINPTPAPTPAAAPLESSTPKMTRLPALRGQTTLDHEEGRRPTWGELASRSQDLPPLETEGMAASDRAGLSRGPTAVATSGGRAARTSLAPETTKDEAAASCDYDERLRRIFDFRLPDLDGKPVRFQDLDADLVLIDFWGTWCKPCLRSVPHLVDLQERMGKKLKVIGIACEQENPEQAAAKVAEMAKKLKINYPVLLSRNDGSCPVQEALHIQAFPTMVLVDRQGRVLWRDQGATTSTLSRLDYFIASNVKADGVRRY